jgi:hypothetical protein
VVALVDVRDRRSADTGLHRDGWPVPMRLPLIAQEERPETEKLQII